MVYLIISNIPHASSPMTITDMFNGAVLALGYISSNTIRITLRVVECTYKKIDILEDVEVQRLRCMYVRRLVQ